MDHLKHLDQVEPTKGEDHAASTEDYVHILVGRVMAD